MDTPRGEQPDTPPRDDEPPPTEPDLPLTCDLTQISKEGLAVAVKAVDFSPEKNAQERVAIFLDGPRLESVSGDSCTLRPDKVISSSSCKDAYKCGACNFWLRPSAEVNGMLSLVLNSDNDPACARFDAMYHVEDIPDAPSNPSGQCRASCLQSCGASPSCVDACC